MQPLIICAAVTGGAPARNNAEMVEQCVVTARTFGRPVATPAEARGMLGIGGSRN